MNLHVGKVVVVGAGITDHDVAAVAPGLQAEVLLLDRSAASSPRSTVSTSGVQMGGVERLRNRTAGVVHRTATYARSFSLELAYRGWCSTRRVSTRDSPRS